MINTSFGKIYEKMYEGSLVGTGALTFAVMGYVIAKQRPVGQLGNQRMEVMLNPKVIGPVLGEPEDKVVKAIEFLCQPDGQSGSPGEQGKRLVKVGAFEYWVVNGMKYRDMKRDEDRKEQNRLSQQRFRDRHTKRSRLGGSGPERRSVKAHGDGDLNGEDAAGAEGLK